MSLRDMDFLWRLSLLGALFSFVSYVSADPLQGQVIQASYVPTESIHVDSSTVYHSGAHFDWATMVANADSNLREENLPDPVQAKMQLEAACERLQRFLAPDLSENGIRWLNFLQWDKLMKELSAEKPSIKRLSQIRLNMHQNYSGLEMQQFTDVRESLERYIHALQFGVDRPKTVTLLRQYLKSLSEKLQAPVDGSDCERQREIGLVLHYLQESKQATTLVESVKGQFSRPNARVLVSQNFLLHQLNRPVSQPNPVNEEILGTRITGTSCLVGNVRPVLVSNSQSATLRLELMAQFSSDNRGVNRGVTIYSQGSSPVSVSETISLTDHGLQTLNDTSVATDLHTDITGIQHRLRIVRKIASKQVAKKSPEANAIGESRLQGRLHSQFHEQLVQQLSESNSRLGNPDFTVLKRLGLSRPSRTSWSSNSFLSLLWNLRNGSQLTAPASCPIPVENDGLTIQIHQSIVQNMIDPILAGRILQSKDMAELVKQFSSEVPAAVKDEAAGEEWSISMAAFHPVEVEFDNDRVTFRIRATDMSRGDQELGKSTNIEAKYRIEVVNGNEIQLYREGEVDVDIVGKATSVAQQVTLRTFLKKKFDSIFREQLLEKPATPLNRLPAGAPALSIASIRMDDGWIQVQLR